MLKSDSAARAIILDDSKKICIDIIVVSFLVQEKGELIGQMEQERYSPAIIIITLFHGAKSTRRWILMIT